MQNFPCIGPDIGHVFGSVTRLLSPFNNSGSVPSTIQYSSCDVRLSVCPIWVIVDYAQTVIILGFCNFLKITNFLGVSKLHDFFQFNSIQVNSAYRDLRKGHWLQGEAASQTQI